MASLATAQRNRAADAVTARCNNGVLRIYSGTVPANADAALSGNTLLAELAFGATAFGAAVSGVATANAITQDSSNDNTGTPTFFRAFESGGSVVVFQGTASATSGGGELQLSGLSGGQIIAGGTAGITSLTYTQAAG